MPSEAGFRLTAWATFFGLAGSLPLLLSGMFVAFALSLWFILAAPLFIVLYMGVPLVLASGAFVCRRAPFKGALLMLGPQLHWILAAKFFAKPLNPNALLHASHLFSARADQLVISLPLFFTSAGGLLSLIAAAAAGLRRTEPRLGLVPGLALALLLSAGVYFQPKPELPPITVSGWVGLGQSEIKLADTGSPAALTFEGRDIGDFQATTDQDGRYSIALPPGIYRVRAKHPDAELINGEIALHSYNESRTASRDFSLTLSAEGLERARSRTTGLVAVRGRLFFDGKPLADTTPAAPVIRFPAKFSQIEIRGHEFIVRAPRQNVGSFSVLVDANPDNPPGFPGDLEGYRRWDSPLGLDAVLDVPLRRIIRLTSPVDNEAMPECPPCGASPLVDGRVVLAWALPEKNLGYRYSLHRKNCLTHRYADEISGQTSEASWTTTLPPSAPNEEYDFSLQAYRGEKFRSDRVLGGLITCQSKDQTHYGFSFRVRP